MIAVVQHGTSLWGEAGSGLLLIGIIFAPLAYWPLRDRWRARTPRRYRRASR